MDDRPCRESERWRLAQEGDHVHRRDCVFVAEALTACEPRRRTSFRFGGCCRRSLSRLRFHAAIVTLEAAKLFTLSAWRHPARGAWMQLHNGLVEVNVSMKAARLGRGQVQTPIPGDLGHPLQADWRRSSEQLRWRQCAQSSCWQATSCCYWSGCRQ